MCLGLVVSRFSFDTMHAPGAGNVASDLYCEGLTITTSDIATIGSIWVGAVVGCGVVIAPGVVAVVREAEEGENDNLADVITFLRRGRRGYG